MQSSHLRPFHRFRHRFPLRSQTCHLAVVALLFGCEMSPTDPEAGRIGTAVADLQSDVITSEPHVLTRLDLEVRVSGTFRPGDAVRIVATTHANLPANDVELRVVLPEVEAARMTAWNNGFRIPVRVPLQPLQTWRFPLSSGTNTTRSTSVVIPAAGYYRVVVTALVKSSEPPASPDGREVQNVTHQVLWLEISDEGGRLVPRNMVRGLGPSHDNAAQAVESPGFNIEASLSSMPTPTCTGSNAVCGWAGWYNYDTSTYVPFAGVEVVVTTYDAITGDPVAEDTYYSDSDGYAYMYCESSSAYYTDGYATLSSSVVEISPSMTNDFGSSSCGSVEYVGPLDDEAAKLLVNLEQTIPASQAFFGHSRQKVRARVTSDTGFGAAGRYYHTGDSIVVRDLYVWDGSDGFGKKMIAHEYGHALHYAALGGYSNLTCSSSYSSENNLFCAFVEGFAEYHAVNTATGISYFVNRLENNTALDSGEDGSIVPYALGALFFDLTDAANEADDDMDYTGSYVADLLQTCQIYTNGWHAENAIDHFIYCLENTVDSAVTGSSTYFPTRTPDPTAMAESAAEPSTWSQTDIRDNWTRNLYNQ